MILARVVVVRNLKNAMEGKLINQLEIKQEKFSGPLDVLLSLIDNELRKQDVHGEALIQVANSGFENIQTDETLPFYEAGKNNC